MFSELFFQGALFAFAIVGLIFVFRLRVYLGRIFPTYTVQLDHGVAPLGTGDLYDEATNVLSGMGFEGPVWFKIDSKPRKAELFKRKAVFFHRASGTLCWLLPIIKTSQPNRLLVYWTTKLNDGRVVTSQAFDYYFESISTKKYPARTINGVDYYQQFDQHLAFVDNFSSEFDPTSVEIDSIIYQAGHGLNERLDDLIANGYLFRNARGVVRGRLKYAVRSMWLSLSRPTKTKHENVAGAPVERLSNIADFIDKAGQIAPERTTQLVIFGVSLILSCVLGSILFDRLFAVILVGVVLFHEFGHYLAMRLFGYTNVHMLALPLVGGVTIGSETHPSAARKAWMAIMGPLPGIVLGWLLLWISYVLEIDDAALRICIYALLFINYLNVLPILPLDGGHVVQSLIPGKWYKLQPAIIFATCIVGIILGMISKFYIISLLCGLQLPRLIEQFKLGKIVGSLAQEDIPPDTVPKPIRRQFVFQSIEKIRGPSRSAKHRLNEAAMVLDALYRKKLSMPQWVSLCAVYGLLIAAPIFVLVANISIYVSSSESQDRMERQQLEYNEIREDAKQKTLHQLITYFAKGTLIPAHYSTIGDTESRLKVSLPDELREIYHITNGLPELSLVPVEQLKYVNWTDENLKGYMENGKYYVEYYDENGNYKDINISEEKTEKWISLRDIQNYDDPLFVDLSPASAIPGGRYIDGYNSYESIREWLETRWTNQRIAELQQQRRVKTIQKHFTRLASANISDLADEFNHPNLLERLLSKESRWPKGVKQEDITAIETKLAIVLPQSVKDLYKMHDAFKPLSLYPLGEIDKYSSENLIQKIEENGRLFQEVNENGQLVDKEIYPNTLGQCYKLGGYLKKNKANDVQRDPFLLWCPDAADSQQHYVDLRRARVYQDFSLLLRYTASERKSY